MSLKVMRTGVSRLADLVDGQGASGYPGGRYLGRDYYVNNISGDSGKDGTDWDNAFAQVSSAITAAEAYRATILPSTNQYIRNRIFVQGTGTAYTALTALPSYCDVIGVGAVAWGNGTGIPVIGANGADGIAGTARGLRLLNLQIVSGGSFWCADFVSLFRSEIAYCCFQSNTVATDGAIRFSASSGGNWIHHNWMTGSGNVIHVVGMQVQGGNFDSNRIEYNEIIGTTAGVLIDDTVSTGQLGTAADNTVFFCNFIGDLGRGCAKGVDDNEIVGMITYMGNYITATDAMELTHRGTVRAVGNHVINGTTGAMEVANS